MYICERIPRNCIATLTLYIHHLRSRLYFQYKSAPSPYWLLDGAVSQWAREYKEYFPASPGNVLLSWQVPLLVSQPDETWSYTKNVLLQARVTRFLLAGQIHVKGEGDIHSPRINTKWTMTSPIIIIVSSPGATFAQGVLGVQRSTWI